MSQNIHPTAIIEDGATIHPSAKIGAYCVIGADVVIGEDVILKSHVCVEGVTHIGKGTQVFPFTSLGSAPQDLKFDGEKSQLIIGENNVIREHVTMNPGTKDGIMKTVVGDNCLFMMATHVAHDCVIGNNVILANNATLAGHVTVGDYAILGGLSAFHQFVRIGAHAIIGGMSGVESDVIPYGRVKGDRAHLAGLNLIGLERRGYSKDQLKSLQRVYNKLFADKGTMDDRIKDLLAEHGGDELLSSVLEFAQNKDKFPLCRPKKK